MTNTEGWAIICDARMGEAYEIETLALVNRRVSTDSWWTSDDVETMMRFTHREAALRSVVRLKHNNPRVVPFADAVRIIANQQVLSLQAAAKMDDDNDDNDADFESDMSHSIL